MNETQEFLHALFQDYQPWSGYIETRLLYKNKPPYQKWWSIERSNEIRFCSLYCQSEADNSDVYIGVYPRDRVFGSRIDDVLACGWLYIDADIGVKECEFAQPNIIVNSGSGQHWYFKLTDPIYIEDQEDREFFRDLLSRLDYSVKGGHCIDLARILRVPGTLNHKTDPAKPVTLEKIDLSYSHGSDWWDRVLPQMPQIEPKRYETGVMAYNSLQVCQDFIDRKIDYTRPNMRHVDIRNVMLVLKTNGIGEEEIRNLALRKARACNLEDAEWYVNRTLKWVMKHG